MGFKYKLDDQDSWSVVQGEDRSLVIRIMDDNYNPVDLTGASLNLQLPKSDDVGIVKRPSAGPTFLASAVDSANDKITIADHGFVNDDVIQVTTNGVLPTGLSVLTNYSVQVVDKDTIQLAAAASGSAIDLTGAGTGTHSMTFAPLVLNADPKLGKMTISLPAAATAALKAGDKQSLELEYTISGVKRIVQMLKAVSVAEQVL